MPMINCRIVSDPDSSGHRSVIRLADSEGVTVLYTFVQPPYRSIIRHCGEMMAATSHSTLRDALRFHRQTANQLHGVISEERPQRPISGHEVRLTCGFPEAVQ